MAHDELAREARGDCRDTPYMLLLAASTRDELTRPLDGIMFVKEFELRGAGRPLRLRLRLRLWTVPDRERTHRVHPSVAPRHRCRYTDPPWRRSARPLRATTSERRPVSIQASTQRTPPTPNRRRGHARRRLAAPLAVLSLLCAAARGS